MKEDVSFNSFLKAKLEEEIAVPEVRLGSFRASLWRRPALLAASLAVIGGIFVWQLASPRVRTVGGDAICAIEFLEACDGCACSASDVTFSERLLAWQDAPYEEVVQ